MNALTILLALLVVGCGALDAHAPALDTAATKAAQTGGCLLLVCDTALWSDRPLQHCRPAVGRCERK